MSDMRKYTPLYELCSRDDAVPTCDTNSLNHVYFAFLFLLELIDWHGRAVYARPERASWCSGAIFIG